MASRMTGFAALGLMAVLPLGVALGAQAAPPAAGPVAAVFPPWWPAARAFAAAGTAGPVARFGGVPFIVVVAAPDRARLRAAGAWLLLDPHAVGGCAPTHPGAA
jgi:hypothetical protein